MLVSRKALAKIVHLDDVSTEQMTTLFNNYGGLEVESVSPLVPPNKYVVGHVLSVAKHPNADTLNVAQVNIGTQTLEIVCGAPNLAVDQRVIVAPVGTIMPNEMKIEARDVRGVVSNGMICSLGEIGIDTKYLSESDQKGIYVFDPNDDVTIGSDALSALDFDTEIFDLSITPNRADCLNYRGLAHEVAALTAQPLDAATFTYELPKGTFSIKAFVDSLTVPTDNVHQYNLIAYKNVQIKPAPQWMQSFLIAHDVRPINNVVDITNYLMLYLGLPLHAFDADKLPGSNIVVRQARAEEKLITLDEKTRNLSTEDVVISTGDTAIALAGVMGGANTEIDANTTSVVLEAAIFAATAVRKTSIRFDLRSEASLRMEKMLDPTLPQRALMLVSQLMVQYADAEVSTDTLSYMKEEVLERVEITANYQTIAERIGAQIDRATINDIFNRLSFTYANEPSENTVRVTPPTWRPDIQIFEDLVEEVARLYGLENVPNALPVDVARPVFRSTKALFLDTIHDNLQALGLQEALTYTLKAKDQATLGGEKDHVAPLSILYPLNTDRETLRNTTYYSMLEILQYHYNHAFPVAAFYEITEIYGNNASYPVLSFGSYGVIENQPLYGLDTTIDFYLLKTWFERLLSPQQAQQLEYRKTTNSFFHPGVSAAVYHNDTYLGTFGKIHPQTATDWNLQPELYVGEFRLDEMYQLTNETKTVYEPISKYPSIARDMTLVTPRELAVGELTKAAGEYAGVYAQDVQVYDVYTGEHIDRMKKSVTLRLLFNSRTETLTNDFVSDIMKQIVAKLEQTFDVSLRQ